MPVQEVWDYLLGEGLPVWLGEVWLGENPGERYRTASGTRGEVRSRSEGRRIRLTWQPQNATHDSTLQLTLIPAVRGTTIAVHQERLTSRAERENLLDHWRGVLDALSTALGARPTHMGRLGAE